VLGPPSTDDSVTKSTQRRRTIAPQRSRPDVPTVLCHSCVCDFHSGSSSPNICCRLSSFPIRAPAARRSSHRAPERIAAAAAARSRPSAAKTQHAPPACAHGASSERLCGIPDCADYADAVADLRHEIGPLRLSSHWHRVHDRARTSALRGGSARIRRPRKCGQSATRVSEFGAGRITSRPWWRESILAIARFHLIFNRTETTAAS